MGSHQSRAEQRGRIPSLNLLATLLLMQPRTRLAFWAVSAHWWLMSNFSSTTILKSFSAWRLSIHSLLLVWLLYSQGMFLTLFFSHFSFFTLFQNSPLYQYLQDLGHTDFEVCSSVSQKAEQCAAAESLKEQAVHAAQKVSALLFLSIYLLKRELHYFTNRQNQMG